MTAFGFGFFWFVGMCDNICDVLFVVVGRPWSSVFTEE